MVRLSMPPCGNCGEYVTRHFVRVFGIDGEVYGCPECSTYRELHAGDGIDAAERNENGPVFDH